jgi:hypothetical protein
MEHIPMMVENAFYPSKFAATVSAGQSATVVRDGSSGLGWILIILCILIAGGLLYAWYLSTQQETLQKADVMYIQ